MKETLTVSTELIEAQIPVVRKMAARLYAKNKGYVDLDDLFGAGLDGLIEAATHFKRVRNCPYPSYAKWWVVNKMFVLIRQERWITHIPDYTFKRVLKLMKAVRSLSKGGRVPTIEELSEHLELPPKVIHQLFVWSRSDTISLDAPVGDGFTTTRADFLSNDEALWPTRDMQTLADLEELTTVISHALDQLSARERLVVRLRYFEDLPLPEIARQLHISRARTAEIEAKGLRKLRRRHGEVLRAWLTQIAVHRRQRKSAKRVE